MTFSKHQLERNSLDLINGVYFSLLIYLSGKYQRFLIVIYNALRYRSSFNAIHFQSLFKVDIFVPKNRPFDEQELQRRNLCVVSDDPEKRAYVASVEDIILAKLDWYRQGNEVSEQQWRDVTGIFKATQGQLDVQYLQQTANQLGVLDLLQRLIPIA